MTGAEVELHRGNAPDTFAIAEDAWRLANRVAKTEFVPKGLQGSPEKVLAAILKGHELDLPPMTALASIHVVNGRPGLSAELQRGLVTRAGHSIDFTELTTTRVTCHGRRSDNGSELTITWTLDDAKRAKLDGKDVWRAYPRNMLAARASADVCKFLFADVIGGLYTIEELTDLGAEEVALLDLTGGEAPVAALEQGAAPTAETVTRRAPARKRAAKQATPQAAAAPAAQPPLPSEVDAEADTIDGATALTVLEGGGEDSTADVEDPNVVKRASMIAMKANELGVDRAEVIYCVTGGAKTSGKALTEDEAFAVLDALRLIKSGGKHLITNDDGEPELIDGEEAGTEEEVIDGEVLDDTEATATVDDHGAPSTPPETWTPDEWRAYLSANGIKVVPFIQAIKVLAAQIDGEPEPLNPGSLQGRPSLAALAYAWVEEQIGDDA